MAEPTLTKTIEAARQGDPESFRALVRHYTPKVRGTLRQMAGTRALDDQTQEVFVRIWRGLPKLRNANGFSTWVYRITWNVAMDGRKNLARERERQADCDEPSCGEDLKARSGAGAEQETRLLNKLLVEQGLVSLTPDLRDVLVLSDLEELAQDEVAAILEIPVGTVKSRLFTARARMRQFLKEKGVQP